MLTNVEANKECVGIGTLGTWKFDQEAIRKSLAHMLIVDELSFKFVQGEGFKKFLRFKLPSRWTLTRDCFELYMNKKYSLKLFLEFIIKE